MNQSPTYGAAGIQADHRIPHTPYGLTDSWKEVQALFPSDHPRLEADGGITEYAFAWRGHGIHMQRAGNRTGDRVILHHGVGTHGRLLMMCVGAALAARGLEVIAVDMPPYGMSAPGPDPITYDDWVAISDHIISAELARDDRPVFLYGLSAGGMLAFHAAAVNRRVSGVIGMCFLDMHDPVTRALISKSRLLDAISFPAARLLAPTPFGRLPIPVKSVAKMKALTNHDEALRVLLADRRSGGARVPLRFMGSFLRYRSATPVEEFDVCPILLTQPECNKWTPLAASERFMAALTVPAETVMLEGAGHYPMEQPGLQQLEDAIVAFIDRYAGVRPTARQLT